MGQLGGRLCLLRLLWGRFWIVGYRWRCRSILVSREGVMSQVGNMIWERGLFIKAIGNDSLFQSEGYTDLFCALGR